MKVIVQIVVGVHPDEVGLIPRPVVLQTTVEADTREDAINIASQKAWQAIKE